MKYEYIRDPGAAAQLALKLSQERVLGLDLETTGLDAHSDKVVLLSLTSKKGTYLVDTQDVRCLTPFKNIIENEEISKVGFNLAFDHRLLHGYANIEMEGCKDLMLAEQCLEAGVQWDGFSLAAVTKKYLGKERDKTLQKSFIGHKGEFTPEQLLYAAEDTADLFPLGSAMQKKLIESNLTQVWAIENNSLPAWADIQFYGQKTLQAKSALDQYFKPFFDADLWGNVEVNYNSQQNILYGLKKMGVMVEGKLIENTNKETQKKIMNLSVIQALQKHREAVKAYGTYGQTYIDAIHPKTGRIHPGWNQYGTDTGRPAGRGGLTVLTIPRDKRFRNAFITDSDRLLSTVDYAAAEVRIMADQSGDPFLIEGFNTPGSDVHCYVASLVFGCEVTKKNENAKLRQPAKAINFGFAYGMRPGRLFNALKGEGYKTTYEECEKIFSIYKSTFKVAVKWLETCQRHARENLSMTNIAGRRRR